MYKYLKMFYFGKLLNIIPFLLFHSCFMGDSWLSNFPIIICWTSFTLLFSDLCHKLNVSVIADLLLSSLFFIFTYCKLKSCDSQLLIDVAWIEWWLLCQSFCNLSCCIFYCSMLIPLNFVLGLYSVPSKKALTL